jgi:U3 small nucleolar RNA-associated protein 6
VKRLGIKNNNYSGQRRIFFILDRGTRKFHGDIRLWMQYIEFARKQKSSKKLSEIITSVLRLHPTKPELWIYAANHVMEERDDIIEARAYMQRGLRFCKEARHMWLEYAKLEMTYVAKLATRGQVLGLNRNRSTEEVNSHVDGEYGYTGGSPKLSYTEKDLSFEALEPIDQPTSERLEALPVVSGAIPIAIFDAAMKHFQGDVTVGEEFFDMIAGFHGVQHTATILEHITRSLGQTAASSPIALSCFIRQPLVGVGALSPEFPGAFALVIDRLNSTMQDQIFSRRSKEGPASRSLLAQRIMKWILSFISDDLDSDIIKVITITLKKLWKQYQLDLEQFQESSSDAFIDIYTDLQEKGFADMVSPSKSLALRLWPHDPKIQSLQNEVTVSS